MRRYIYNAGSHFSGIAEGNANTALKYPGGRTVTYMEMEALSNRIAHFFIARGLVKGDVVALFNNKSPLGYACMLAALKTGIIYTNLDLTSPFQRVKKIIERCRPKLLLFDTDCPIKQEVEAMGIPALDLYDDFEAQLAGHAPIPPSSVGLICGTDPAYIMFTSGSTGFPKGAVITHSGLLNFISWGQAEYSVTPDDIFTNANPIYFDNSVFDFYISLFSGAQLVPITNDLARDPFLLIKEVAAANCTTWFSVPSLLVYLLTTKALSAGKLPAMKRFIFGGEGFPKPMLKKLFDMYGADAALFNVYGPTECTCICSSYRISERDFEDMNSLAPLGYLAPNFSYVLLGADGEERFGELALKGPNVGIGYYNDHERSEQSFIQNPYHTDYNEIVYRTGDLVQVDDAGQLHFKGRADNQIKHMGYRIELEEIESILYTLGYVNEAAVIYDRISGTLGQILAFISASAAIEETEVIAGLKKLLPEYMVPRKVIILDLLPKNQNGKIDKIALRELKKTA